MIGRTKCAPPNNRFVSNRFYRCYDVACWPDPYPVLCLLARAPANDRQHPAARRSFRETGDEFFDCRGELVIALFRIAFPDLHCAVEDEIVEGDRFAVRLSIHGTHRGMFLGNSPTGKQVNVPGIVFGRTENGRIIEDWTMIDQTNILQQMGLIPPVVRL
jgi:predicted ester cyclase